MCRNCSQAEGGGVGGRGGMGGGGTVARHTGWGGKRSGIGPESGQEPASRVHSRPGPQTLQIITRERHSAGVCLSVCVWARTGKDRRLRKQRASHTPTLAD